MGTHELVVDGGVVDRGICLDVGVHNSALSCDGSRGAGGAVGRGCQRGRSDLRRKRSGSWYACSEQVPCSVGLLDEVTEGKVPSTSNDSHPSKSVSVDFGRGGMNVRVHSLVGRDDHFLSHREVEFVREEQVAVKRIAGACEHFSR